MAVVRHGPFYSDPRVVKETLSLLDEGDVNVTVLCRGQTSRPWFERRQLKVISIGRAASEVPLVLAAQALVFSWIVALKLWRIQPQVVIVHSIPSWILLFLTPLRWAGRTQAILLDHHEPEAEMLREAGLSGALADRYEHLEALALRRADGVIDVSDVMADRSRRLGAKKQVTVDNCPQIFPLEGAPPLLRWDIAVFGSLIARYDLSALAEALEQIDRPLSVLQMGAGDSALSRNASGGNLRDLGYLDPPELQRRLRECRFGFVGLAPSAFTNLVSPNRLWELVALGVPAIVAATELTTNLLGDAAIFYEGGHATSLERALIRALCLEEREREAMAREASIRLRDRQWERESSMFVRFVSESLGPCGSSGPPN